MNRDTRVVTLKLLLRRDELYDNETPVSLLSMYPFMKPLLPHDIFIYSRLFHYFCIILHPRNIKFIRDIKFCLIYLIRYTNKSLAISRMLLSQPIHVLLIYHIYGISFLNRPFPLSMTVSTSFKGKICLT